MLDRKQQHKCRGSALQTVATFTLESTQAKGAIAVRIGKRRKNLIFVDPIDKTLGHDSFWAECS